jgi:hypothetical protein
MGELIDRIEEQVKQMMGPEKFQEVYSEVDELAKVLEPYMEEVLPKIALMIADGVDIGTILCNTFVSGAYWYKQTLEHEPLKGVDYGGPA